MNELTKLEKLYSDYLFGDQNHQLMKDWAYECLLSERYDQIEDVVLLSSSNDNDEILQLTRSVLKKYELLAAIEASEEFLINRIKEIFPTQPLPRRITNYKDNDPEDYDGEGQDVTDHFKDKPWNMVEPFGYALTYFSSEAFVYYLPVYLIKIIEDLHPNTDITDCVFWAFSKKYILPRLVLLNDDQKKIVVSVLRHVQSKTKYYYCECKSFRELLER